MYERLEGAVNRGVFVNSDCYEVGMAVVLWPANAASIAASTRRLASTMVIP